MPFNKAVALLDGPAPVSVPDEAGQTISVLLAASIAAWVANTVIALGALCKPTVDNGYTYKAKTIGSSPHKTAAATQPTWPTVIGVTVVDADITWECTRIHRVQPNVKFLTIIPAGVVKWSDTDAAAVNAPSVPTSGGEIRVSAATIDNIKFYASDVAMTVIQEG